MSQCDVCVGSLGLVTVIRSGIVLRFECLYCGGVGYFCSRCEQPADESDCSPYENHEPGMN